MMHREVRYHICFIVIALSVYSINRFTPLFSSMPYIGAVFRNHFNDYLGAIVFISYVNILFFLKHIPPHRSVCALLLWGSVCSLVWEGIAPLLLSYSTADLLDCLAYYLGMLTYRGLIRLAGIP